MAQGRLGSLIRRVYKSALSIHSPHLLMLYVGELRVNVHFLRASLERGSPR